MPSLRPFLTGLLVVAICNGMTIAQVPNGAAERSTSNGKVLPPIPPTPSDGSDKEGAKASSDPLPWLPGDAIWLKTDEGRLVPVPYDARMKDFLQWLKNRNKPTTNQPDFSITSISFEGSADDDGATLTAKIQIQVQSENAWVRVPVRMDEANLLPGSMHKGVGEGYPLSASPRDTGIEPGYAWHLKGRGLHELTVPMVVKLRKQTARRLELSLPRSTASSLKLRISTPHVRVLPVETGLVKPRAGNDGATDVEVVGLGEKIDLRWIPQADTEATLLAATSIRLSLARDGSAVLLKANQKIQARQGTYQRVKVQMPPGFDLQSGFEVQNGQQKPGSRQFGKEDVGANNMVTVELEEPTEGLIELQWELEAPFPKTGQLSLAGFQVERARMQQGEIAIRSADGYRIKPLGGEPQVHRIDVSELSDSVQVDSAYRFNQQPFSLDLRIEAIEPQFFSEPVFFLRMSSERIELIADLRYTVNQGAVSRVELKWPGWREDGWQIDPPRNAEGAVDVEFPREGSNDTVRIRVVDPSQRKIRQTLRAERAAPKDGPVTLSLPRVVASNPREPILIVVDAENVESKIEPVGGTSLRPLPQGRRNTVEIPDAFRNLSHTDYQIDSVDIAHLSAALTVHQRQLEASSLTQLQLRNSRLQVNQRISYDVKYEPAAEIGLLVPKSLSRRAVFAIEDKGAEVPLNPIWTPQESALNEKARFTLPEPRKGQFDVVARFEIPVPDESAKVKDFALALPLIQSSDATLAPVRVGIRSSTTLDISIADTAWIPQIAREEDPENVWMASGEPASIPLQLNPPRRDSLQEFTAQKSFVRTALQRDGNIEVRAQYRIEGAVSMIDLGVPAGSMNVRFWWDTRPLESKEQAAIDASLRGFRLAVSREVERGSHLLTVSYSLPDEGPLSWIIQRDLLAPRFAPGIWVEESVWEIVLPLDRYLWSYPEGYSPEFRWERNSFFMSRVPRTPYDDPAAWIGAIDGPTDVDSSTEGNSYVFSRTAPATSLRLVSMHQSMVLLFGAGLALGAGFLLLKVPATRSVLTPLVLAFIASVLWMFAAAPLQLLLQPALLGLLLAVLAAVIDGVFKQEPSSVLLTVAPAGELAPSHVSSPSKHLSESTASRPVLLGAGSDDPTAMRPLDNELAESLSSHESGTSR